jgi:hypothetical protein
MDFRTRNDPEWKKNLPRDPREFGPKNSPGHPPDDRLLVGEFGFHFRYISLTSSKRAAQSLVHTVICQKQHSLTWRH